jgi:hypothetical protein
MYRACLFSHKRFVVSMPWLRRLLMNPVWPSGTTLHVHGENSALHRANGFDDASRWLCAQAHNQIGGVVRPFGRPQPESMTTTGQRAELGRRDSARRAGKPGCGAAHRLRILARLEG